jgi:hypothetical protein
MNKKNSVKKTNGDYPHDILNECRDIFERGSEIGFWEALRVCNNTRTPHPQWVADTIRDHAKGKPLKKQNGCPPRTNVMRDFWIYTSVTFWRENYGVTPTRAFKMVQDELREGLNMKPDQSPMTIDAIRAAYRKGEEISNNRLSPKYYISTYGTLPVTSLSPGSGYESTTEEERNFPHLVLRNKVKRQRLN